MDDNASRRPIAFSDHKKCHEDSPTNASDQSGVFLKVKQTFPTCLVKDIAYETFFLVGLFLKLNQSHYMYFPKPELRSCLPRLAILRKYSLRVTSYLHIKTLHFSQVTCIQNQASPQNKWAWLAEPFSFCFSSGSPSCLLGLHALHDKKNVSLSVYSAARLHHGRADSYHLKSCYLTKLSPTCSG